MIKKAIIIFSVALLFSFSFCVFAQELSDVDRNQISQNITNFIFALQRNDITEVQSFFDATNYKLLSEVKGALSKIKISSYDLSEQNISVIGQEQVKVAGRVIARGEEAGGNWQVSGWPVYFVFNKIGEKWLITDTDFHNNVGLGDMGSIAKKVFPFLTMLGIAGGLIAILLLIFWFWMLLNCFKRDFDGKNKWLALLFFTNFIGAFFYYFLIKKRKIQRFTLSTTPEQTQAGDSQQKSSNTTNKPFYSFLKVFLACFLIFAVIFVIAIYFIFHQTFSTMSGFGNFMDKFSSQSQNLPKPQQVEEAGAASSSSQNNADKSFSGQVYRNEVYGFEIKYPKQIWSLKDTLPKVLKQTIRTENVEFFSDPFPTSITRFVLYANPIGFGTEYCNINYKISTDGLKILSVDKGEDQCSPQYQKSHPNPVVDKCSDGIRYACFDLPTMNNGNFYWGYLEFSVTGNHPTSEADADALLQKILFSFKAF